MKANLWSDEQKSHKRLHARIRLPNKSKSENYPELLAVNVADTWRERFRKKKKTSEILYSNIFENLQKSIW